MVKCLVKEALKFRDMQGNLLYKLDEKVIRIRESFDILKPDGQLAAKVHNAIIDPLRERFTIEIPGGQNMMTMGKVIWAQYDILRNRDQIAKISKQFSWIGRDIPTIWDIPEKVETDIVEVPDPNGPWGARGLGELPFLTVAPVIGAAIHDATGVWIDEFPFTPERVLKALGKI